MSELFATAFGLVVLVVVTSLSGRGLGRREHMWIGLSALAHGVAAIVKVWIVYGYYGDGDMTSYVDFSQRIAELMRLDPRRWILPYMEMAVRDGVRVPYLPPGDTAATRAVYSFTALHQFVFGPSRYGISLLVAAFSMASKVAVYRVFRAHLPAEYRDRIAIAVLLIPSAVFWSSSLSKEGLLWMSFGWVVYGFHRMFFERRPASGMAILVAAAAWSALFKAYVLFPFAVAAAVWLWARSTSRLRRAPSSPLRALATTMAVFAVASLLVVGLGELFPRYKIQNFADQIEDLHARGDGGSGDAAYRVEVTRSVGGQLAAAPVAVLTALYRPLVFEARNPLMLVNAIETTFLLLLSLYILVDRGLLVIGRIRGSPTLLFCATFVLLLAVAVGLTSTNLGTLSRYRMPLMPFFGVLIAVLTPLQRRGRGHR